MFLRLFPVVLSVAICDASVLYQKFSDNQSPYTARLVGPYWTFPVANDGHIVHRSDYLEEPDFDSHFRFKRAAERRLSVDDEKVVSDHEFPRYVPTKPDYNNKGAWAKGKIPGKETNLGFVPLQVYTQVRRYDTVKHLPQSEAIAQASTPEEVAAAPRLREVLSHKKIQQVYEEEGYEDTGYDHGGYNHEGAKYEDVDKNEELDAADGPLDSQLRSAEGVEVYAQISGEIRSTTTENPLVGGSWKSQISESNKKSTRWGDGGEVAVLLEEALPRVEDSNGKYILIDGKKVPIYKNTIKDNRTKNKTTVLYLATVAPESEDEQRSRESLEESRESIEMIETAESRSGVAGDLEYDAEGRVVNDPRPKGSGSVTFPGRHTRRQYAIGRPSDNWTPMAPADVYVQESVGYNVQRPLYHSVTIPQHVHHYVPYMPPFPSYYSDTPTAYASQVPQILKLSPKPFHPHTTSKSVTSPPTISAQALHSSTGPIQFTSAAGTLNTYAALISDNATATTTSKTTTKTTTPIPNRTNIFSDIVQPRINHTYDFVWSPSNVYESSVQGDSLNLRNSSRTNYGRKRQYNNFTRGSISFKPNDDADNHPTWPLKQSSLNTRHPSLPRDSNEQFSRHRTYADALVSEQKPEISDSLLSSSEIGPVKYIEQLTIAHYSSPENINAVKSAPQVQNDRLIELAKQLNAKADEVVRRRRREASPVRYDSNKYPYYETITSRSKGNRDSALKYATNSDFIPRKTAGGMEFYESRDKLIRCEDPKGPDDVVPEREEDGEWNAKPQADVPRLKGLGDTIQCFKVKYFGKDPLDNPFFQEEDIGDPPTFDFNNTKEAAIYAEVDAELNKRNFVINAGINNERLMVIPQLDNRTNVNSSYNNSFVPHFSNHKMNYDSSNVNNITFPYKNHKPEAVVGSPSIYDLRITSPFKFHGNINENQNFYSTHEQPDEGDIFDVESSKRHKHYHRHPFHHHHRHKHFHKKKRYRPHRQPVSIYSIITTNGHPTYYRPLIYAHSLKSQKVIPIYQVQSKPQTLDNVASDSQNTIQAKPTKYYIVRPGEYTENKDIASDKKESPSIWSYMNPFKWWFPNLFDNRRKEPKYRRRRSSDYVGYDKVLSRDNRKVEEMEGESSIKFESEIPVNHRPETTTGPPISLSEFKVKLNISDRGSKQSRLNRLTGGFLSRSSTATIGGKITDLTPYLVLTTLPPSTEPTSRSLEAPTLRPKVLFPRTKAPKRRPQQYKKQINTEGNVISYTTTTTTTTPTPTTTTPPRMYKPKRVITRNYGQRGPFNAFTVLRRPKISPTTTTTEYPFELQEGESASEEEDNPRRLQQVEHRRVTKEEVYKTTYIPEEQARENRDSKNSGEEIQYSVSTLDSQPVTEKNESSPDNETLTYLVNPATGVGSWGEQPRKRTWKPKRTLKRPESNYKSLYSYPTVELDNSRSEDRLPEQSAPIPKRTIKRQRDIPQENYGKEAYIVGLMSKVPPVSKLRHSNERSHHRAVKNRAEPPALPEDSTEQQSGESKAYGQDENGEENYPSPTRSTPQFIVDPDKRKYYYVKD